MPKISVIMPVYNTPEEYLREAIESILNQTYGDFEFIILNDGSTNNVEDVIVSYKDNRICYIKNPQNLGLIKTLNLAIKKASGEYIARMDSDDISNLERFEEQINFFENNPDIIVLGTNIKIFPKNRQSEHPIKNNEIKKMLIFTECCIAHPSVMVKKEALNDTSYNTNFKNAEDYALWLSLIDTAKFANIPKYLYNYRWHENNVSKTGTFVQSLNSQYLMFEAQGKFLDIDSQQPLNTIAKLKKHEKINSKELKEIENFVIAVNEKIIGQNIDYCLNRTAYKIILKNCKKDLDYLKLLWNSPLNNYAQMKTWTKIENTLRIF